jgi:hypothetical protein
MAKSSIDQVVIRDSWEILIQLIDPHRSKLKKGGIEIVSWACGSTAMPSLCGCFPQNESCSRGAKYATTFECTVYYVPLHVASRHFQASHESVL